MAASDNMALSFIHFDAAPALTSRKAAESSEKSGKEKCPRSRIIDLWGIYFMARTGKNKS
jgi:hypothetical protein